jgi:hypothetical protein
VEADAHIAAVTAWLDVVHVESAWQRVEEMQERYRSTPKSSWLASYGEMARCAAHEAAHAVIANCMGLDVRRVCVHLSGTGSVQYDTTTDTLDALFTVAVADLAGIFSELHAGVDGARQEQLAHSGDLLRARLNLDRCRAGGWDLTMAAVATASYCAVRSNWDSISRIAACLLAVNELTGVEIAALCGRSP